MRDRKIRKVRDVTAGAPSARQAFAKRVKVLRDRLRRKYGEMEDVRPGFAPIAMRAVDRFDASNTQAET